MKAWDVARQEWRRYWGEVFGLTASLRAFGMNLLGIAILYIPVLVSMLIAGIVLLGPTILFKAFCMTGE